MPSWILSTTAFSLLVVLGGLALETMVAERRLPRRFIWVVILLVITIWPMIAPPPTIDFSRADGNGTVWSTPTEQFIYGVTHVTRARELTWGPLLAKLWFWTSALLAAHLLYVLWKLQRLRASGRSVELDGHAVVMVEDGGPAVFGLFRPTVVIPRWFTELSPESRELILRHEFEHRRVSDQRLLMIGALAVVAMPWNLGLWWAIRRFHLAIEIDCDTRTLADGSRADEYGRLLLLVSQRKPGLSGAVMLAGPARKLQLRLQALGTPSEGRWERFAVPLLLVVSIGTAWQIPIATSNTSMHLTFGSLFRGSPTLDSMDVHQADISYETVQQVLNEIEWPIVKGEMPSPLSSGDWVKEMKEIDVRVAISATGRFVEISVLRTTDSTLIEPLRRALTTAEYLIKPSGGIPAAYVADLRFTHTRTIIPWSTSPGDSLQ